MTVSKSLTVRTNHDRLHAIESPVSFEATESFAVVLENGDAPVHVHLHLDDALSAGASIAANNNFLDAGATRRVQVTVDEGARPVEGRLEVVTGHGAETDHVNVSLVEPDDDEERVAVDARLGKPRRDPEQETDEPLLANLGVEESAPVVALGLIAVAVALGATALAGSGAVVVGALAVLASVGVAGYFLFR